MRSHVLCDMCTQRVCEASILFAARAGEIGHDDRERLAKIEARHVFTVIFDK